MNLWGVFCCRIGKSFAVWAGRGNVLMGVPMLRKNFFLLLAACVLTACDAAEISFAVSDSPRGHYIKIGSAQTFLKKTPEDSGRLSLGSEKCSLTAKATYLVQTVPQQEGKHLLINLSEMVPECGFSKGYVFADHVAESSLSGGGTYGANANVKAFLDVLGYAEGTDDQYNFMFTHVPFSSYADHPRSVRCSGRFCSDAAGRYQFLSTTWDGLKHGAGVWDFSPESQDKGCLYLLKSIGVYNTIVNISSYNDFSKAVTGAGGTWASLPGSPHGQSSHSLETLWAKFQSFRTRY
jgi:muramidase (phage lysozyme)